MPGSGVGGLLMLLTYIINNLMITLKIGIITFYRLRDYKTQKGQKFI